MTEYATQCVLRDWVGAKAGGLDAGGGGDSDGNMAEVAEAEANGDDQMTGVAIRKNLTLFGGWVTLSVEGMCPAPTQQHKGR